MPTDLSLESLKERNHTENLDVYGIILLKWILGKWGWNVWSVFTWFRI
jgi:hypothetical protein